MEATPNLHDFSNYRNKTNEFNTTTMTKRREKKINERTNDYNYFNVSPPPPPPLILGASRHNNIR